MKKYCLILSLLFFAHIQLVAQQDFRGTIRGKVVDVVTKAPIAGCYVYLSGYTKGITTKSDGSFVLSGIPNGVYELVLSHVSFQKQVEVVEMNQKNLVMEIRLGETTTTLETVYVTNVKDLSQRRRNLKKFKEFFFGEDYRPGRIKIENEQDIELTKTAAGIVQSTSDYMLNIDNDYLGYKINYYLKDFLMSRPTNMVLGFPKFSPKQTDNPAEALYWTENRQRVFNGSIRHFFKSLISQQLEEEGFETYLTRKDPEKESEEFYKDLDERKLWLDDEKLPINFTIEDTQTPNIKKINFGEVIEVNYAREFVKNGGFQNSKIKLIEDYVYVFENGVIVNPSALKLFGQWSKEGMYQMLPSDYVSNDTLVLKDNQAQIGILNNTRQLAELKPTEKVFVHTQANDLYPGETLWYKVYLTAGANHKPSPLSKNVYVELLHQDSIVKRHILKADEGMAPGSMELSDLLEPGRYTLRAYTRWMRNQSQEYFFQKLIHVHHPESKLPEANPADSEELKPDLQFFPEGGNMVAGVPQKVAFKITNQHGLPIKASGTLSGSNGNLNLQFQSEHNGMGLVEFIPTPRTTYTAKLAGSNDDITLPFMAEEGLALSVDNLVNTESVVLKIRSSNPQGSTPLFMIAQTRGRVNYTLQFELENGEKTLLVPKSLLGNGIVHFTLFSQTGVPIAERLTFNEEKDVLNINISSNQTVVSSRDRTELVMKVTDNEGNPVSGSFSLSALHDVGDSGIYKSQHIDSYLLLSSDLKGYIHDPEYYFDKANPNRHYYLDLVMRTHGWTRFRWQNLYETIQTPYLFDFEKGIEVTGRLMMDGRRKGVKNGTVTFIGNGSDALTSITSTDKKGYFSLKGINPPDNKGVLLKGMSPKGNKRVNFRIDSVNQSAPVEPTLKNRAQNAQNNSLPFIPADFDTYQFNAQLEKTNKALNEEEENEPDKLPKVRESIYGAPSYSVKFEDLTNGNKGGNAFHYLNGRIPGLRMTPDGPIIRGTTANPFAGPADSTTIAEPHNGTQPLIYLDNSRTDMGMISAIPVEALERLEILKGPEAFVLGTGAQSGAMLFFTKIGADIPEVLPNGIFRLKLNGYHVARDFYVPAYDQPMNFVPDHRKTIFWEPEIITDQNGLATIAWFNTDYPGEVIVNIEGLSFSGTPGHTSYRYQVNIKE